MSLFGRDPRHTWGAIRNAQLAPIHFPSWQLRVYLADLALSHDRSNGSWTVPPRIVKKLMQLGADIVHVTERDVTRGGDYMSVPPRYWRYLVIDDASVEWFIVRDADSRLSERDAAAVGAWVGDGEEAGVGGRGETEGALHCVRDHPKHVGMAVWEGLWGGRSTLMRTALRNEPVLSLVEKYLANTLNNFAYLTKLFSNASSSPQNFTYKNSDNVTHDFLLDVIWRLLGDKADCFDSVTCPPALRSYRVDVVRKRGEYLGQKFDEHHELVLSDQLGENSTCSADTRVARTHGGSRLAAVQTPSNSSTSTSRSRA